MKTTIFYLHFLIKYSGVKHFWEEKIHFLCIEKFIHMYILTHICRTITLKTRYTLLFNRFIWYNLCCVVYEYLTHNYAVLNNHNIKIYNPLNAVIVAHLWMGVGPPTGEWKFYQWSHPQKRMILLAWKTCYVSIALCTGWSLDILYHIYAVIWAGLVQYQSCNNSWCKFMTINHAMSRKQNFIALFSSPGS